MTLSVTRRRSVSSRSVGVHSSDRKRSLSRQLGATLLEASIYLAVVGVIGAPIATIALASTRVTSDSNTFARVMERNRASAHRIGEDLDFAVGDSLWIHASGKVMGFYLPGAFDGSGAPNGHYVFYVIAPTQEEWLNDVDDNNNGVVDEVALWRQSTSDNAWTRIATSLDYDVSGFEWSGGGIAVTLTSVGYSKSQHAIQQVSNSVVFQPRN